MLDVGAEASDSGKDGLAGLRVPPQLTRQCEEPGCGVEIDIGGLKRSRQGHPLRFDLSVANAELDVMAIGPLLEGDRQAGHRIDSERGVARGAFLRLSLDRERPGVATSWVVGTADECTKFTE